MKLRLWFSEKKRTMPFWGAGVILATLIAILCAEDPSWTVWDGSRETYSIVLLGDSILGNIFEGEGVSIYLEEQLGKKVLDGAFGGTCAANDEEGIRPYSVERQLNLVKLSEAIVNQDFSVQKAQIAYGEHYHYFMSETLSYFPETARKLSEVDFSKVKYLVIEHGTNDYNKGRRLDNPEDPFDETTFGGALRRSLEILREKYPDMELILMTPTWCYVLRGEERLYCDSTDFGGGYLEDYVNLEAEIAKEYGVWLLDNYHDSGIDQATWEQYLLDGLHINQNGQRLLAGRLADMIRGIEDVWNQESGQ